MSNKYYSDISDFRKKICEYTSQIFKYSSNELILRLEQLNLLNNEANCLESSTAFGFIIEEFLVSKLDEYTINHNGKDDYRVQRTGKAVSDSSYDCIADIHNGIRALINVKVCKAGGANNAVAAIQQLHYDYVESDPEVSKCFLVLKVHYSFCRSIRNASQGERAISIEKIESFFLDEIDMSKEHMQDHRSWSGKRSDPNAGRLQVSDSFLATHRLLPDAISYKNTVAMLNAVCNRNGGKTKSKRKHSTKKSKSK